MRTLALTGARLLKSFPGVSASYPISLTFIVYTVLTIAFFALLDPRSPRQPRRSDDRVPGGELIGRSGSARKGYPVQQHCGERRNDLY